LHHSADIHGAWENITENIEKLGKENMDQHEESNINCGVMNSYQNL
jgi:hypothetical protein